MSKIIPLFRSKEDVIKEALEHSGTDRLILVYVNDYGELECLASENLTIIEGVGMLETAKAGFIISSYENET